MWQMRADSSLLLDTLCGKCFAHDTEYRLSWHNFWVLLHEGQSSEARGAQGTERATGPGSGPSFPGTPSGPERVT